MCSDLQLKLRKALRPIDAAGICKSYMRMMRRAGNRLFALPLPSCERDVFGLWLSGRADGVELTNGC
jgi:hypothetical protein